MRQKVNQILTIPPCSWTFYVPRRPEPSSSCSLLWTWAPRLEWDNEPPFRTPTRVGNMNPILNGCCRRLVFPAVLLHIPQLQCPRLQCLLLRYPFHDRTSYGPRLRVEPGGYQSMRESPWKNIIIYNYSPEQFEMDIRRKEMFDQPNAYLKKSKAARG
jgi:hypothetical protein